MAEVTTQTDSSTVLKRRARGWLPVALWLGVIFLASTDLGSTKHSSRIIGPILRWFNPDVSQETIDLVQLLVRKGGHLSEYAILGMLAWRARRVAAGAAPFATQWNWQEALVIVLCCAAYAASDEFHQRFVATRQAQPLDVFIDTTGALCGLLLIWAIGRFRRRW